jgi:hypothetical protein
MSWNSINWVGSDIREDSREIHYEHNVLPFGRNRSDACLQAMTAAQAVEIDRMEMNRDRLIRDLGALVVATRRKEEELAALNAALGRSRG